jgi:hypothetical protein
MVFECAAGDSVGFSASVPSAWHCGTMLRCLDSTNLSPRLRIVRMRSDWVAEDEIAVAIRRAQIIGRQDLHVEISSQILWRLSMGNHRSGFVVRQRVDLTIVASQYIYASFSS